MELKDVMQENMPQENMNPDLAQIVNTISAIEDPERKVSAAITLIMEMGEDAIPLLQQALNAMEFGAVVAELEQIPDEEIGRGIGSLDNENREMAFNGGRIGFQDGGDEELLEPGVMQTDPNELLDEIEAQGSLQTSSRMGEIFMQAMEDSAVLEIDSWLMKYQPFGLKEDDYFNFRTMGPQVRGPRATEGLATLKA
jgi:hypothetical protein